MVVKIIKQHFNLAYTFIMSSMLLLTTACSDDTQFSVGSEFVESDTYVTRIDTFGVELSTVQMDSMVSSSLSTMLVGSISDSIFGTATCESYTQFGLYSSTDIDKDEIYDSITCMLYHTGYSYGDTTQNFNVTIHRLTEEIDEYDDDDYFYNTTSFAYDPIPLGSIDYRPFPGRADSIEVRLDDSFGKALFNLIQDKDETVLDSDDHFVNYFNGLHISSTSTHAVLGFDTDLDRIAINLYSHDTTDALTPNTTTFPANSSERTFNHIDVDKSSSYLNQLSGKDSAIHSSRLNGYSFLQAGVGLFTKLRFPTLGESLLFERGVIVKADLILYPSRLSYDDESLPETLYMYETNRLNSFGDVLYASDGSVATPTLNVDREYNENTFYAFDVTTFVKAQLEGNYYNNENGLLLSLETELLYTSLEKVIFQAQNQEPELRIYYLSY